jgi:hypothetical protein
MPIAQKMTRLVAKGVSYLEYDGTDTLGTLGTPDNNLRYIGANPNNYVYYNCSTTNIEEMSDSTCEKWRIIGLMNNIEKEDGTTESLVKIRRSASLGKYAYHDSGSNINSGFGANQWGESTYEDGTIFEGSFLMRELNTDYLGNITIGTDGKWYGTSKKNVDKPTSSLNSNSINMIETVKWNVGALNFQSTTYTSAGSFGLGFYLLERSNNTGRICSSGSYCNDGIIRTTIWNGKIALFYPSDYYYATSGGSTTSKDVCLNTEPYNLGYSNVADCTNNNWLYTRVDQSTLSPCATSDRSDYVYYFRDVGSGQSRTTAIARATYPTLYLKSAVQIATGDGSESNPYKLVM